MRTLLSNYGMIIVLVLLCVYYAWATVELQNPQGAAAGQQVAAEIAARAPKGPVLIVGRAGDADTPFIAAARDALTASGYSVADSVQGDPRAAKQALTRLAESQTKLTAIAATSDTAQWPPILNRADASVPVFAPQPYRYPTFLKKENLLNVASQIVVTAILAIGLTLVILTGGIDLSVGSLIAVSAVVTTVLIRDNGGAGAGAGMTFIAAAAGIGLCGLIGAFSGVMITAFRIPPFIATLAVMQIGRGMALRMSGGQSIGESAIPAAFTWLGRGRDLLGVPNSVILLALLYAAAWVFTARTRLGRYVYAVGGNPEAARLSGVRVNWILMLVYILSGLFAGLGGVLYASEIRSGDPKFGDGAELYAIAAVVVGGTSLTGGSGKVLGTLIGALIIGVINNGMNLTGVSSYNQRIVLGFVILGAVLLDMLKKRPGSFFPAWLRLRPAPKS